MRPTSERAAARGQNGIPPPWTDQTFVVQEGKLWFVGRSELHGDMDHALAMAQADAIAVLLYKVILRLEGSPLYKYLRKRRINRPDQPVRRVLTDRARDLIARYRTQAGHFATPEKVDSYIDAQRIIVRYSLPEKDVETLVELYGSSAKKLGMTAVPYLPILVGHGHAEGDILIVEVNPGSRAAAANIAAGDVIVRVANKRVSTLDGFKDQIRQAWDATRPGEAMSIEVRKTAATRTVELVK